ncbi:MAG: 2-dehydropantoate 2-reductase [Rubrivivax sp.]|nr:2-dehydropantoate 2-reductase [Rubrivivax sp.]
MKICIVGLGAIGGQFAAWLHGLPAGRVELSALARGATLEAVRTQGLIAETADGERRVPLRVAASAAELGPQDLVVLAVKGPALAAVAPAVAELAGAQGQVLTAMNGVPWWFFAGLGGPCDGWIVQSVDPGGAVGALLPAARVIGGVVHLSSSTPAPGRVRHVNGNGLIIGHPAGARDERLDAVATLLADAGFAVTVSERIQRDVWFKLWGNMTINPVSALTGATADRILDDPLVRGFCSAVMLEAQAIGAAFGIPIDQQPEQRHAVTRKLGAFRSSMLQDLEAGRPMEVDALVGAVREIGQRLGLATPNIDALLGLVRLLAQQRGLWSPPAEPAR